MIQTYLHPLSVYFMMTLTILSCADSDLSSPTVCLFHDDSYLVMIQTYLHTLSVYFMMTLILCWFRPIFTHCLSISWWLLSCADSDLSSPTVCLFHDDSYLVMIQTHLHPLSVYFMMTLNLILWWFRPIFTHCLSILWWLLILSCHDSDLSSHTVCLFHDDSYLVMIQTYLHTLSVYFMMTLILSWFRPIFTHCLSILWWFRPIFTHCLSISWWLLSCHDSDLSSRTVCLFHDDSYLVMIQTYLHPLSVYFMMTLTLSVYFMMTLILCWFRPIFTHCLSISLWLLSCDHSDLSSPTVCLFHDDSYLVLIQTYLHTLSVYFMMTLILWWFRPIFTHCLSISWWLLSCHDSDLSSHTVCLFHDDSYLVMIQTYLHIYMSSHPQDGVRERF